MIDSDVCFAGVLGRLDLLRSGRATSADLVTAHLDRIRCLRRPERLPARVRGGGAARGGRRRRAAGCGEDAPLLGIPIAVKEETDLAGLPTTFGTDAVPRSPSGTRRP